MVFKESLFEDVRNHGYFADIMNAGDNASIERFRQAERDSQKHQRIRRALFQHFE